MLILKTKNIYISFKKKRFYKILFYQNLNTKPVLKVRPGLGIKL